MRVLKYRTLFYYAGSSVFAIFMVWYFLYHIISPQILERKELHGKLDEAEMYKKVQMFTENNQ
jgi:hypothetical protein